MVCSALAQGIIIPSNQTGELVLALKEVSLKINILLISQGISLEEMPVGCFGLSLTTPD